MAAPPFPVHLQLDGRKCLVVGGGAVAHRKVKGLLLAGAHVTVVSPSLKRGLTGLLHRTAPGRLRHLPRPFRPRDLEGSLLAVAATDDPAVNQRVAEAARRQGTLVNVVDSPRACDFLVPSVLRRGPLCISVSTSGASPALAKSLREELQRLYGPSFGRGLSWLSRLRGRLLTSSLPAAKRRKALKRLAAPPMLGLLRRDPREFRRQSTRLVSKYLSPLREDRAKG